MLYGLVFLAVLLNYMAGTLLIRNLNITTIALMLLESSIVTGIFAILLYVFGGV